MRSNVFRCITFLVFWDYGATSSLSFQSSESATIRLVYRQGGEHVVLRNMSSFAILITLQ